MSTTDTKAALWRSLSLLMQNRWGGVQLRRLAREADLGPATVLRIKAQDTAVTLDTLEAVASVFQVEPWTLIAPGGASGQLPLMCLSAEALDLAMTLDEATEKTRKAQAYALAMHAIRAVSARSERHTSTDGEQEHDAQPIRPPRTTT
ncbi:Cro/C1-type helix-turn-helix domain containing protein [uncultured Caudovirales phage]|uniref:Cro/C1-type helix-turn-helix domain containing protein n=1 Tax=uncultured Caudovirales phage TaxID=2100421 RepID=A0A6J5NMJ6_9CAUD|nr:Cro/C1-type helix-turn-helix domain containing protein [uncultured Caudovirales phage]